MAPELRVLTRFDEATYNAFLARGVEQYPAFFRIDRSDFFRTAILDGAELGELDRACP